jgi:PAS domain S-box-containing protein
VTVALVGVALFGALHHLHFWWARRESASLLFAATCASAAGLCLALASAATATTLAEGQRALHYRTTFGLLTYALLLGLVRAITGLQARAYRWAVTTLLVSGVLINELGSSLVGSMTGIDHVTLPWGESVAVMSRPRSPGAFTSWFPLALYAGVISVHLYALAGARVLWSRDRSGAMLMTTAGLLGMAGSSTGLLVDLQIVRWAYLNQLPVAIWLILVAVLLSRDHARRGDLLQASERRFRAIFDQTFQFIGLLDVEGRLLQANRTALQFAAIGEEDVIGKPFWDTPWWRHSPDQQQQLKTAVARAAAGEIVRFETSHPTRNGQTAYVDFSLKPVRNERGEVTLLIPEGRDVTERHHTEQALAASEARFRTLIETAPEAIVVFDVEQSCFTQVNEQACRLFNLAADELRRLNPVALSPPMQPDGRPTEVAARGYLDQAIAGAIPVFEWRHRTLDGKEIPCEIRLVRLPDPARVLIRGSITDITKRLELDQQLRQSQKMQAIGQLAGGVAHDFNNLLTVISGSAEMLREQLPPSDSRRELVDAVTDASRRAAWLTDRLLAFSRRAVLAPQLVDLNNFMRDAEQMLRRLIGADIHLTVALHPTPVRVTIDPGQWNQVILNLAINARDAMPSGGQLSIATTIVDVAETTGDDPRGARPGRYACLSIGDTGCGMTPDVMERLFEPFFTTKPIGRGTGLGLAVVHGIVTQAGGLIDVTSTPGQGTSFTVSLPLAQPAPAIGADTTRAASDAPHLSPIARTIRVLLVEDEAGVRRVIEIALRRRGATVVSASDGREALHVLDTEAEPFDLLITDMVMPGNIYGHQLADIARQRFPQLKTLFISGYLDEAKLPVNSLEPGRAFLYKPFTLDQLAAKVDEMIAAP